MKKDSAVTASQKDAPGTAEPAGDGLTESLSEVHHDANNALSVISGNAQLLAELARAEKLGAAFTEPLEDIQQARVQLSETLDELDRLRRAAAEG